MVSMPGDEWSGDDPKVGARRAFGDLSATLILIVALLGAALVRIATAHYSLWFDELASVFFASQPLPRLWSGWMVRETNPPLFYSILHGSIALLGLSETTLRIPSIIASLLAIVVVYAGVARSFGRTAAATAALLLATSPLQLYFSHQVRAYIFLYLAIAISFFGLLRVADTGERRRDAVRGLCVYAAGAIAAIYLHTTAILWPAAASLSLMLVDRRFRPFRGTVWLALLTANAIIAVGATWWLYMTALQLLNPNGNLGWMQGLGVRKGVLVFLATILQSRQVSGWGILGPTLIGLLVVIGIARTRERIATRLTVTCFVLSTGLFLLLNLGKPIFLDRTIVWLSIFPLVMAAIGLSELRGRSTFWVAGAVVLVSQCVNLALIRPQLLKEDWRPAVFRPAGDRNAVLFVDGEAMNVAVRMACATELHGAPCPFPVVTLMTAGPQFDSWARDYATPAVAPAGRLRLQGAHAYVFGRPFHDVFEDLHDAGLLHGVPTPVPLKEPLLIGPLPASFVGELQRRSHVTEGLARLDQPRP